MYKSLWKRKIDLWKQKCKSLVVIQEVTKLYIIYILGLQHISNLFNFKAKDKQN
jgi:hypothetical protein